MNGVMVTQRTLNPWVVGSNPTSRTTILVSFSFLWKTPWKYPWGFPFFTKRPGANLQIFPNRIFEKYIDIFIFICYNDSVKEVYENDEN